MGEEAVSGTQDKAVYINVAEGLSRIMNNKKLYSKLLNKFKVEASLDDLRTALESGDLEKARGAAHTIKGTAGNLSLIELQKQALELETRIKNNIINPNPLADLERCFNNTLKAIDKALEEYGG